MVPEYVRGWPTTPCAIIAGVTLATSKNLLSHHVPWSAEWPAVLPIVYVNPEPAARGSLKDIFLCHTGADKDWVRVLGGRLEDRQINNRAIEVFFDEWDVDFGENIIAKIDAGLKQSRFVGLVLSPRMVEADWPTAEWQSQVMADPSGKRGKILPLLRHKFDPDSGDPLDMPFVLAPLKRFDFTRDQDFERELERLVRKLSDLPPSRGSRRGNLGSSIAIASAGQEAADVVEEALPSNLFAVLNMPEFLYSDVTHARTKRDVWSAIAGKNVPPFLLYENRLVSFIPPATDNPFRDFLVGSGPLREPVTSWLAHPDKRRQLVGLLNGALREHCYHLGIRSPKSGRTEFYCPIFGDGEARAFRWGTSGVSAGRSRGLAKMKARPNGTEFGVHMSAGMRFISIGDRLFLIIEPGWLFTTDGVTPLTGKEVGRFSTLWGGKERNAAVLRNVLMWGLLIANGRPEILLNVATDVNPIYVTVQSVPVHTKLGRGIAGDSIRLDRILGGDGAGEVKQSPDKAEKEADRELDEIADLALVGALVQESGSVPDDVGEADVAEIQTTNGGEGNAEEDLELPF